MSLKSQFLKSSAWGILGTGVDNIIQFIVFIVLARLLPVEDIGFVAFVILIIDLGRIFVYGGLPEALIQAKTWDDESASVCFHANMLMSLVSALLLTGASIYIGTIYERPDAVAVVGALSLIFVIDAARAVHVAKLRRDFQFKSLALRSTLTGTISGAGAVYLAFHGWGVWALVAQRLLFALMMTLTTWFAARFRPRFYFSLGKLRELLAFSSSAILVRFLDIINLRITDLLVGLLLGPAALGYYRVGSRSLEAITRLVIRPFQDAAFSTFSRVSDTHSIGRALTKTIRFSAFFLFPLLFGTSLISTDIVALAFGESYVPSGRILSFLSLGTVPATFGLFLTAAVLGGGMGGLASRMNILTTTCTGALSAVFMLFGTTGAAAGNSLAQYVAFTYNERRASRAFAVEPKLIFLSIIRPLVASLIMYACIYCVTTIALDDLNRILRLFFVISLSSILYIGVMFAIGRGEVKRVFSEFSEFAPNSLRRFTKR